MTPDAALLLGLSAVAALLVAAWAGVGEDG
jgi:hypothetical protein